VRRPHPASPEAVDDRELQPAPPAARRLGEGELVMLCVRVAPSLRRRLKLVSASTGRSIQALVVDALELVCKQHGM
jgi:predicted HicB family RNase H-like nuclease